MGTELGNTVDIGFSRQTSILNMAFSVTLKFFRAQLLLCKESQSWVYSWNMSFLEICLHEGSDEAFSMERLQKSLKAGSMLAICSTEEAKWEQN